jgi:hypothetical protein
MDGTGGKRLVERFFENNFTGDKSFPGIISSREADSVIDGSTGYSTYLSEWIGVGTQNPVNKNQRKM